MDFDKHKLNTFVPFLESVFYTDQLTLSERFVFSYLLQLDSKETGYAYPSQSRIAEMLHLSLTCVKRALKGLCDKKLIFKGTHFNEGRFMNSVYYINCEHELISDKLDWIAKSIDSKDVPF